MRGVEILRRGMFGLGLLLMILTWPGCDSIPGFASCPEVRSPPLANGLSFFDRLLGVLAVSRGRVDDLPVDRCPNLAFLDLILELGDLDV